MEYMESRMQDRYEAYEDEMKKKIDAFCAHTMIAKTSHEAFPLSCCDCGRVFKHYEAIESVREYEAETGFVCPDTPHSPM